MAETNNDFDMAQINKIIYENVRSRGYEREELPDFDKITPDSIEAVNQADADVLKSSNALPFNYADYSPDALRRFTDNVRATHVITVDTQLSGSGIKLFFKKVIRKLTRFALNPTREQQLIFNENVNGAINQLSAYVLNGETSAGFGAGVDASDNRIYDVLRYNEQMIETLQSKIVMLEKRIEELERKEAE